MKLRDQQEEVDSLKGYSKREILDLKEQMQLAYEGQLKRITEMVFHCPAFTASIFCLIIGHWMFGCLSLYLSF